MENGHGYGASRPSFSFGRIIGDPFALATISISVVRRPRVISILEG
jgi:SHO1 osmosensor